MHVLVWTVVLVLFGGTTLAHAGETVEQGPAPDWVRSTKSPEDTSPSEAPVKVLLANYQLKFTPRTSTMYVESYIRVQNPQGLQLLGNVTLPWKPDSDVLTVHKLQLLRGDQAIDILAGGQKFEVLRRENNLERAALDGILTATLQPAGMEVGDVLNLAFSIRRESALLPAPELWLSDFARTPVSRVEMRAAWDTTTPLRWHASEEVKGIREVRKGTQRELVWVAENVEIPQQPQDVPSRYWRFPHVEFTTYSSWNDVSRALAPLYAAAATLKPDSALKHEARAIAGKSADPVARIEATLRLVQDRVRYVFLGMGDGNVNPTPADLTWERRFGDCKGKTALLIALLRENGIEAEPVLVTTYGGDAVAGRLPAMSTFDHVIVRARAGGATFWLDGAGSGSWRRSDLATPNYHWGLPITSEGAGLVRMQAEPASEPGVVTSTEIDAREGLYVDAPFKVEVRVRGPAGLNLRTQLGQLAPAVREQSLRKHWQDEYDFVEPKQVSSEYDESTGAMILRMEGTAVMDWSNFSYTTDGLRIGTRADYAREPGINVDAPFLLDHPAYVVTRQRIKLPARGDFKVDGEEYDLTLAGREFRRRAAIENRVFSGEVSTRSLVAEIPAKEARDARQKLNDMWSDRLDIVASGYTSTDADVAALRKRKFTDADDLVWRGSILLNRYDYDGAFADFDAAVKADQKDAGAIAHRGLAHFWKRRLREARADFDAALAIDATNAVALRGLGALQRDRGEYQAAVDSLTRSLHSDANNTFALGQRAYAFSMVDDVEAALRDAAAAIKLDPGYIDMYDLRAWILTSQGKEAQALAELKAMFDANPDDSRTHLLASHNYFRLGRHAEATQAMDAVIAGSPTAANYQKRAGVRDPDDFTGRLADIDAALKLEPSWDYLHLMRAEVLSESGDHKAAAELYGKRLAKEVSPSEKRRLHTLRGIEYQRLGDALGARREFNAALTDADGDSYNQYCWYLAAARLDLASALAACDKALALAPKDETYLDSRGFVLLQLARYDESIASYDAALALKPKLPASLYGRGMAKNRRCQCADGADDLRAGAQGDPSVKRMFARAGLQP